MPDSSRTPSDLPISVSPQGLPGVNAAIIQELMDEEYGSRGYMAKDLEGNQWYFGTYQPGAYRDGASSDPNH
ncbi:MAG: hypothetical protein HKN20_16810 [Gemmatimonadetes bacterium]|nr:hypothetical protein [Gemmatimonadota bacterium]